MKTRDILVLCGAAAMLAGPVLAQGYQQPQQQQQPSRQTPPGQRDDQRNNQRDLQRDNQRDTMRDSRLRDQQSRAGATEAPEVLQDLSGVWRVQVAVSPKLVQRLEEEHGGAKPMGQPARNDRDQMTRGADTKNVLTFTGFAESSLIMNGSVLRQAVLMPDMGGKLAGGAQGDRMSQPMGQEAYGLAFLGFDKDTDQYTAAFIDGHKGAIHCSSGTYDASQRRIVFESSPKTAASTAAQPRERLTGMHNAGPVRVVVEQINPNQFRVSMQTLGANVDNLNKNADNTNTPNNTNANPRDNQQQPQLDPNSRRDQDLNQPNQADQNAGGLPEGVLYRAVYTRAEGADAQRFRQMLQRYEQGQQNPAGQP